MADSPYSEDVVKNSQGTLGLVLQDAEETSDESDSDEEVLKKGQIVVCWYPSGREETINISKVQLADRSLLPGDVIKLADPNLSKQKGYISDVEVSASVKVLAAGQVNVVKNIDCRELHPLQELVPGVHVTLGPWFGIITESNQKLILKMKNGSRCSLEGEQTEVLYDMADQRDEECPFYSETFYPGQVVGGPSKAFKDAKWLSGIKPIMHNQSHMKATVVENNIVSCEVNWQVCGACSYDGDNSMFSPPQSTITGKQLESLKVINHYRHASIQMGDKAFYIVKESDLHLVASTLGQNPAPQPLGDDHTQKQTSSSTDTKTTSEGETTSTQDDTTQKATTQDDSGPTGALTDSTDEDPEGGDHGAPKTKGSSQGSKHDAGPSGARAKRRRKRAKRKRKPIPPMQVKIGDRVCVEVSSTCTTVSVVWQDRTETPAISSTHLTPVFHLDEHEFFPGDFASDKRASADTTVYGVVLKSDCDARTCDIKWFNREGLELSVERDVSVYDIAEHSDFVFNSGDVVVRMVPPDYCTSPMATSSSSACVGQVINVNDNGQVNVLWVDGAMSLVIPQELYKVDTEDDDHSDHMDDHGSHGNSEDEWETASDETSDEESHDQDPSIIDTSTDNRERNGDEETNNENQSDEKVEVDQNAVNIMISNRNPAFMILGNTPDEHHFKLFPFMPQNQRKIMTTLQKELALLHNSLPPGILVRSFEDRVDLYRVMITGPVGTPYEHGLFLFDVRLTPNYPNTPPQFHYLSMCSGRLNPNLYEDGKVCVSLLGTWSGKGSEVWTPKSNILQVLISIQGLILNDEPYYNEAGYEKQRGTQEGLENSRLYNEMAILKMLQSMARMISKPPFGFENEIRQHFAENVPILLRKFNWWLEHKDDMPANACLPCHKLPKAEGISEEKPAKTAEQKQDKVQNIEAKMPEEKQETAEKMDEPLQEQKDQLKETTKDDMSQNDAEKPELAKAKHEQTEGACAAECIKSDNFKLPEFPLFPLSKGFQKSLENCLEQLKKAMVENNLSTCLDNSK